MPPSGNALPRHILLATDLSARCDRASDRAIELARNWNARLSVVHALDVFDIPNDQSSAPDLSEAAIRATRLMRADFLCIKDVEINLFVGEGRPEKVVLDIAAEKGCDLIVTGIAGNDALGQSLLGGTVAALTRRATVPVLVVKKRPRGPYNRVTVASDLSAASGASFDTALRLFRPQQLTLFHAFDIPLRSLVQDKAAYERELRLKAMADATAFLVQSTGDTPTGGIRIETAQGDPAAVISEHAAEEDIDLVIAGTHGRTGFMHILLGSVADAILDKAPCDVMIVPSKGSEAARRQAAAAGG